MVTLKVWPESIPFPEAIGAHVREIIAVEMEALERDCGDALRLTPPEFWHRLIIVDHTIDLNRPRVPRAVACLVDA